MHIRSRHRVFFHAIVLIFGSQNYPISNLILLRFAMEMIESITHRRATNVDVLREHAWLLLLIGGYCGAAYLYARWSNFPIQMSILEYMQSTVVVLLTGLVFILCWYFIYVMIFIRPRRLTIYVLTTLRLQYL